MLPVANTGYQGSIVRISEYQKKIGTYDKQQWEKTVEQRILHGLTHVMKKTAKLKTDLIDVDLVRGSSFPKAKPKHGLITVTKLAVIRSLFLPLYAYWWIQQTCLSIFCLLLLLYVLQLSNMIIYFSSNDEQIFKHISSYEILVPAGMMLVLSIIHSQIVSTNNSSQDFSKSRSKRRRIKRRNFSFDSKAEVYSSKELISSPIAGKNKRGFKVESVDENSARRKNIGWCIPLQNITELKDSECNEETEEGTERKEIYNNKAFQIEDDGFESLNSNGSSENGEENQYGNQPDPATTDEEVPDCGQRFKGEGRREEKRFDGDVKDGLSGGLRCNDRDLDDSFSCSKDCSCNVREIELEEGDGCCFHKDSRMSAQEMQEERNENSFPDLLRRRSASGLLSTCEICDHETDHKDTDSDASNEKPRNKKSTSPPRLLQRRRGSLTFQAKASQSSFYNSSCESDDGGRFDGPNLNEGTTSAAEWIGITTNSEECSVTSEIEESDSPNGNKVLDDHPFAWEFQLSPSILSPSCASSDKVSCTIWENNEVKRADLSVLDISSAIIARVERMRESMDYFYAGIFVSVVISLLPSLHRLFEITQDGSVSTGESSYQVDPILPLTAVDLTDGILTKFCRNLITFTDTAFGSRPLERFIILSSMLERFLLSALFFFLVAVAERTFKQRFLYAKFFSRLTSFRRARKSELPHFRLNKVRNIKTWLSVRSYLKKRGPQRSVDVIVSTAFIITLLLLSFLSVELLKDSMRLHSEWNLEAVVWCLVLGIYLLRFMTLGNKTNRKYRNLSVLLTEQRKIEQIGQQLGGEAVKRINLYLQIEQKPHKKEELMVANSVLKLAADLLKELECPFKISGLSANPYIYTITKVVILSALSGVLSELLGFKLKLHKIKIK